MTRRGGDLWPVAADLRAGSPELPRHTPPLHGQIRMCSALAGWNSVVRAAVNWLTAQEPSGRCARSGQAGALHRRVVSADAGRELRSSFTRMKAESIVYTI